jgi:hypothetical protein
MVTTLIFHRRWELFNYWIPLDRAVRISALSRSDAKFLADGRHPISLPFVWLLRSARLPLWLVGFFFAPFINLMFFLVLCLVPERKSGVIRHTRTSRLGRIVPNSAMGSIAFSLLFTVPASLFVVVGVRLFVNYGGDSSPSCPSPWDSQLRLLTESMSHLRSPDA